MVGTTVLVEQHQEELGHEGVNHARKNSKSNSRFSRSSHSSSASSISLTSFVPHLRSPDSDLSTASAEHSVFKISSPKSSPKNAARKLVVANNDMALAASDEDAKALDKRSSFVGRVISKIRHSTGNEGVVVAANPQFDMQLDLPLQDSPPDSPKKRGSSASQPLDGSGKVPAGHRKASTRKASTRKASSSSTTRKKASSSSSQIKASGSPRTTNPQRKASSSSAPAQQTKDASDTTASAKAKPQSATSHSSKKHVNFEDPLLVVEIPTNPNATSESQEQQTGPTDDDVDPQQQDSRAENLGRLSSRIGSAFDYVDQLFAAEEDRDVEESFANLFRSSSNGTVDGDDRDDAPAPENLDPAPATLKRGQSLGQTLFKGLLSSKRSFYVGTETIRNTAQSLGSRFRSMTNPRVGDAPGGDGDSSTMTEVDISDSDLYPHKDSVVEFSLEEDQGPVETEMCPICIEDVDVRKIVTVMDCNHQFCGECFRTHLKFEIFAGRSLEMRCPYPGCKTLMTEPFLKDVLSEEDHQQLAVWETKYSVEHNPTLFSCITPDCEQVFVWDGDRPVGHHHSRRAVARFYGPKCPMRANCPTCAVDFCLHCSEAPFHIGRACTEKSSEEATEMDDLTKDFLAENVILCKGCGNGIDRRNSMTQMVCVCGYQFCLNCGAENADCDCALRAYYRKHVAGKGMPQSPSLFGCLPGVGPLISLLVNKMNAKSQAKQVAARAAAEASTASENVEDVTTEDAEEERLRIEQEEEDQFVEHYRAYYRREYLQNYAYSEQRRRRRRRRRHRRRLEQQLADEHNAAQLVHNNDVPPPPVTSRPPPMSFEEATRVPNAHTDVRQGEHFPTSQPMSAIG